MPLRVVVDARQFVPGRVTGIGRVLAGLVGALADAAPRARVLLATGHPEAVPKALWRKPNVVRVRLLGPSPAAEALLAYLARRSGDLLLSPYPKLPLWPLRAHALHTPLLRGAFCLAQPSLAEGFGYPPLEAMACGTPAVVSDIAVLRETTGGRALFADPRDPQTWHRAFKDLESGQFYRGLSADGLSWASAFQGEGPWRGYLQDLRRAGLWTPSTGGGQAA